MKFRPCNHIVGKVYDLDQENMTAMIKYIDELEKWADSAILCIRMAAAGNGDPQARCIAFLKGEKKS